MFTLSVKGNVTIKIIRDKTLYKYYTLQKIWAIQCTGTELMKCHFAVFLGSVFKPAKFDLSFHGCTCGKCHLYIPSRHFFLHFRQQIFAAFTEEFVAAPFTDQIFHFIIPALADVQIVFPYEFFLNALLLAENGCSRKSDRAPWLFYFVLTVGETYLGEKAI